MEGTDRLRGWEKLSSHGSGTEGEPPQVSSEEQGTARNKEPQKCEDCTPGPTDPLAQELAQCEEEVDTLLRVIAELNGKMSGLQNPRVQGEETAPAPSSLSPGSECSPLSQCPLQDGDPQPEVSLPGQGGSAELWEEMQRILTALETSVHSRRTWADPSTACDEEKHAEHLRAARESWVQVTKVLEEMEREFGISYPSALPPEERRQLQRDTLTYHQRNHDLRQSLRQREEEISRSKVMLSGLQEERDRMKVKLLGLLTSLQSAGSLSPPTSPSSSSSGALSPCWTSPTCPGSPQQPHRPGQAAPGSDSAGDGAPSTPSSPAGGVSPFPAPQPSRIVGFESETDRLQRCIERLKSRNDRLSAALERRKGESEQISMTLGKHEANCTALQLALKYSEECEEAYGELLSLYRDRKREDSKETPQAASFAKEKEQPRGPVQECSRPQTGESPNLTLGDAVDEAQPTENRDLPASGEQEKEIRARIKKLRQDRAAVCVPEQEPDGERRPSPDTDTLPGSRGQEAAGPHSPRKEKAALLQELVAVREEMSELRAEIRLAEKERRCLEWTLTAQGAQETAQELIVDILREELEDRRAGGQRSPELADPQVPGTGVSGPRNRTMLREIQAALLREQALRKRVGALRGSLEAMLTESATRRRQSEGLAAQLTQAHSSVAGAYRNARRKYREQLRQLERQVAAILERHSSQVGGLKGALQALEWRKEETVL
ncbi:colorectal mutant cancer protein isoform X2 [Lepisosteus oculatus]|uniref:colorectal mutant cancer protein isoform X2 n=1 Tax=Lepisosteus oculatus TaxID=7918 RepID=UPI00073FF4B3|nr:PREDICTED: Usher syndrome type-1C protein-binding protein 1 isoform X2 [Lepisosteus oculatus]